MFYELAMCLIFIYYVNVNLNCCDVSPQFLLRNQLMNKTLTYSVLADIQKLIMSARSKLAREFNHTQILLNWHIGSRIDKEILNSERAQYGKTIIPKLASQLQIEFGRGYDRTSLARMVKFAKLFDREIVATLSQQLSWSHIVMLLAMEDRNKRDFYIEMCRIENWSVRGLRKKINGLFYERTALSKKPEEVIHEDIQSLKESNTFTPEFVFQDPCFLDFMGLKTSYSEGDLENAILDELTKFLQEFGSDFCFVARQKRMSTQKKDRYLDLLFFHRRLRRLIAIELKTGSFEPAHKGQMEWYLNWLDKNERREGEESPLGIILCASKDSEDIEYLELRACGIHVAQYFTELPPQEILERKLREVIIKAREKYKQRKLMNQS